MTTTTQPAASTPSCASCANKILEFCRASYPNDVNLSFGPTKIGAATGGFQYKTPATVPFIYSSEYFNQIPFYVITMNILQKSRIYLNV